MDLSQRYKQAAKEARWALGLAIFYVIGWCVCAYLPKDSPGPIVYNNSNPLFVLNFIFAFFIVPIVEFMRFSSGAIISFQKLSFTFP